MISEEVNREKGKGGDGMARVDLFNEAASSELGVASERVWRWCAAAAFQVGEESSAVGRVVFGMLRRAREARRLVLAGNVAGARTLLGEVASLGDWVMGFAPVEVVPTLEGPAFLAARCRDGVE